jgi:hypothetical protein
MCMNKLLPVIVSIYLYAVPLGGIAAGEGMREERFVYFFAGCALIESSPLASDAEKAEYFTALCAMTGVGASDASEFAASFRSRPAQWEKFQKKVLDALKQREGENGGQERVNGTVTQKE